MAAASVVEAISAEATTKLNTLTSLFLYLATEGISLQL